MDFNALAELLFPDVVKSPDEIEKMFPPRNVKDGAVITRMAPSPTGFVHLGNLVMGLTAERMAHQSDGILYLRIEDTDAKREVPGAVEVLIESLKNFNINFDEGAVIDGDKGEYGPYRQRARKDIYHVYAKALVKQGMAYPCFCTEEELASMHDKQEKEKANFGYFGKWAVWRDRPIEDIKAELDKGSSWVLRFHSNGSIENKVKFTDLIKGNLELTENDIDHVLLKSDGIPTYHFAHAVDDHLMRTTHVVRDDSWLSTLPFHVQLFSALGFRTPKYLHIGPLMKMDGESKRKLSKRKDPELAVTYYHAEGFPSESVIEYLMTVLNSNFEDWRRANQDAPIDDFKFSAKEMNPAGSLFDYAKLCDVSKNVISKFSADKVADLFIEWASKYDEDMYRLVCDKKDYVTAIFAIGRGGKKPRKDFATWRGAKEYCEYFFDELFGDDIVMPENITKEDAAAILNEYKKVYSADEDNSKWFDTVKSICEPLGFSPDVKAYKQEPDKFKGHVGDVSNVIRVAITGRTNSPDLCTVMQLIGYERCIKRIDAAIKAINNK